MQTYKITAKDIVNGHFKEQFPDKIEGWFDCYNSGLVSLKGIPQWIGDSVDCSYNEISSLEYAPQYVGKHFLCHSNPISSLQGIGKKFLTHIGGDIYLVDCPIKSHMLGLLLVKNLQKISFANKRIEEIFNEHLKGDKDILECQEELINNGYKEYAKL